MKLCIFSDAIFPDMGGIQRLSYELPKFLSESEKVERVDVISFCNKGKRVEKVNDKLTIYRFSKRRGWMKGILLFKEVLKRRDFDVFHSITIIPSGFYISLISKLLNKNSFITVHFYDVMSSYKNPLLRRMVQFCFNNSKIIFNSNFTKKTVKNYYSVKDSKVIYPSSIVPSFKKRDLSKLRKKLDISDEDFVILYIGRFIKRKGAGDLVKSLYLINDDNIKLLIIGGGPYKNELNSLVDKYGLGDNVRILTDIEKVDDYYGVADVFSMPSKKTNKFGDIESFGMVFYEAQSIGIPCISTRSGGIPEAIKDNYSGFLVDESSPEQIKNKILLLKNNEELYNKMSDNAMKFSKNFSMRKIAEDYLNYY